MSVAPAKSHRRRIVVFLIGVAAFLALMSIPALRSREVDAALTFPTLDALRSVAVAGVSDDRSVVVDGRVHELVIEGAPEPTSHAQIAHVTFAVPATACARIGRLLHRQCTDEEFAVPADGRLRFSAADLAVSIQDVAGFGATLQGSGDGLSLASDGEGMALGVACDTPVPQHISVMINARHVSVASPCGRGTTVPLRIRVPAETAVLATLHGIHELRAVLPGRRLKVEATEASASVGDREGSVHEDLPATITMAAEDGPTSFMLRREVGSRELRLRAVAASSVVLPHRGEQVQRGFNLAPAWWELAISFVLGLIATSVDALLMRST